VALRRSDRSRGFCQLFSANYLAADDSYLLALDVGAALTDIQHLGRDNGLLHRFYPFAGATFCTSILQSKPSFIQFLFAPWGHSGGDDSRETCMIAAQSRIPNFNKLALD